MKPFSYLGKTVALSELQGSVISSQKRNETKIQSSGGSNVSAPTITSTVTTKHEFWIRTDSGQDHSVQLSGEDIPIAEGQRLGLVSAEMASISAPVLVQVINYNARSSHFLNASVNRIAAQFYQWNSTQKRSFGAALLASLVVAMVISNGWVLLVALIVWFLYKVFRWYRDVGKATREFVRHLNGQLEFSKPPGFVEKAGQ